MNKYRRQHWKEWLGEKIQHIGYWPQYMYWQTEWVHFEPKQIVAELVHGGVEVLEWAVPENYPPVTAGLSMRHPALAKLDYDPYQRLVEECHKHDIKILFWAGSNALLEGDLEFCEKHPDALIKQGVPGIAEGKSVQRNTVACLHNDVLIAAQLEKIHALVSQYDIDGVAIDGPWPSFHIDFQKGIFTCEYCRKSFMEFTGTDKVPQEDWNDPLWKKFIQWRYFSVAKFHKAMYDTIKAVDEKLLVTQNSQVFPEVCYRMPYCNPNDYHSSIDSPFNECVVNSYWALAVTMNVKFQRASAEGRMPGIYHKTSDMAFLELEHGFSQANPSYVDAATSAYLTLANGAWVSYHLSMDDKAQPHPLRLELCQKLAKEIDEKKKWMTNPLPWKHAAVYYSVKTRDFYAGSRPELTMGSFLGAERFLVESHIPSQYVFDGLVSRESLKDYKLLILPNVACMSDKEVSVIKDFVADGGTLLATGETSLYDENEVFRDNFALAEVLGVNFNGINPVVDKIERKDLLSTGIIKLNQHPAFGLSDNIQYEVAYHPWFDIKAVSERQILSQWTELKTGTINACVNLGREITAVSDTPVIVAGQYGRGKVVYISCDLTQQYATRSIHTTRLILAGIANWLAPSAIQYIGPKAVELNVMQQKKEDRIIIHLVNYGFFNKPHGSLTYHPNLDENKVWGPFSKGLNRQTPRKDMEPQMADIAQRWRQVLILPDIQPCDEYIPVRDSKVRIHKTIMEGKKVYFPNDSVKPEISQKGDYYEVNIPVIDIHRLLAIGS